MKLSARFLTKNAVKEAFDSLPSGVCFFDGNGIVTLCNRQMHRLAFALTGRDLQMESELHGALEALPEGASASRDGDVFLLPGGGAWHFSEQRVYSGGCAYTQYVASDVTDLYRAAKEMARRNDDLSEMAANRERINRNVVAIAREEEIIAVKARIHDEMGGSIAAARRFYLEGCRAGQKDELVRRWKKTVALLEGEIGKSDESDAFAELMETAAAVGAQIELRGEMPEHRQAAFLIVCAMRECLTNTLRHANGRSIFVSVTQDGDTATAVITNDGERPRGEITEGGGLGALRKRVEKAGGVMRIRSLPEYALTVTVPLKGEELL